MALAQVEFIAENAHHKVELDRQASASGYVVRVDGIASWLIPATGIGFRRRFALFNGSCTVSAINLSGLYTRYKIEIKQPTKTVTI